MPADAGATLGYQRLVGDTDANGAATVIASGANANQQGQLTRVHYSRAQQTSATTPWSAPTTDDQSEYGQYAGALTVNGQGQRFYADFVNFDLASQRVRLSLFRLPHAVAGHRRAGHPGGRL